MDKESNLGVQNNEANVEDNRKDKKFQDFLKSAKGREILECFDESMKNTGNLTRREIGNFPAIKCKKS